MKNKKQTFTLISDTHTFHRQLGRLKKTDFLIFAGDFMNSGYVEEEVYDFLNWFSSQNHTYKIMIAGNHDFYVENFPKEFRDILDNYPDIIYLEDESIEIEGLVFYGTPHSKHFAGWAFNRHEWELEELFDKIPLDADVLISHAPAYKALDKLMDGRHVGEKTLADRIDKLENLKLHVVGHLHNSWGMIKPFMEHITVNSSVLDEAYNLVNQPIIVKI